MTDEAIVELCFQRDEAALDQLQERYGRYCDTVARNILSTVEECEECVNDMLMRVWEAIPPARPQDLRAFVGRITRNLALDRLKAAYTQKRGRGAGCEALEEWEQSLSAVCVIEDEVMWKDLFDRFLGTLPKLSRIIFVKRYWYMLSVARIADDLDIKEDRVRTQLSRTRKKLRTFLEKEGVTV